MNLDQIFSEMENAVELSSDLVFLKKGDEHILAMCPPLEHNGKETLVVPVDSEYQGQKGKQYIVRFIDIKRNEKEIDWENSKVIGIPLPRTVVGKIVKFYNSEYSLAVQNQSLLMLTKNPKTDVNPSPKTVEIPTEIWESTSEMTWEILLEAYDQSQNKSEEKEEKDSVPW